MKFIYKPSPNYKDTPSTRGIMLDVTIALSAVYLFALVYYFTSYGTAYGLRAIWMMLVAVGVSVITEIVWCLLCKKEVKTYLSVSFPWVTGMILALMCPINTSLYALGIGCFFAIFFGKLLFGGFGYNIFNPAAVGRAVIFASFASATAVDLITSATPATTINSYGWLITDAEVGATLLEQFGGLSGLFLGTYPGAIGETSTLVLLLAGVYLWWRQAIDWRVPVTYLGSIFLMATVIGLIEGTVFWYPLYHLLSGGAVFGAIFMLTDPVTSPTSAPGRIIFALGAAILTMLIRLKANLPEGVLYSILLMNMLSPMIETLTDGQQLRRQKVNLTAIGCLAGVGLALMLLVSTVIAPVIPSDEQSGATDSESGASESVPSKLSLSDAKLDEYLNSGKGQILSTEVNGSETTFLVSMPGYGILHATDDYYDYSNNRFTIVVNTDTMTLVSVEFTVFGDTPKIGDMAVSTDYYALLAGMDMNDITQEADIVSGASYSSMSLLSAIRLVMDELGK